MRRLDDDEEEVLTTPSATQSAAAAAAVVLYNEPTATLSTTRCGDEAKEGKYPH